MENSAINNLGVGVQSTNAVVLGTPSVVNNVGAGVSGPAYTFGNDRIGAMVERTRP